MVCWENSFVQIGYKSFHLRNWPLKLEFMDSLIANESSSTRSPIDDGQRVKFLCSFSGNIMPRPRDGKLRYVGGETRIMSVPRDTTYKELMEKMREIFEGATLMKYQQPDEELDALVSVVNDDDVAIMIEEYDKLESGDGLTRLRIFLFAYPDQDISVNFGDGDERDNERRYMDALNSLNESPDFRRQYGESLVVGSLDDMSASEHYLNQFSAESIPDFHRNMELPMAQMNLSHLMIPLQGSGQLQQAVSHGYNEMEAPWSPAYYSPRNPSAVDHRLVSEVHASPSSSSYCMLYGDYVDESFDKMGKDYSRPPVNTHPIYEQQPPYADNVVLNPAGGVANLPHSSDPGSIHYEGNNSCENCQMRFLRNQAHPSSYQRPGEHPNLDHNIGNGYLHVAHSCVEYPPSREVGALNSDANFQSPFYCRDNSDVRPIYTETHPHEKGWTTPHQANPVFEEQRPRIPVAARLLDGNIVDNGINFPIGHENDPALACGSQVNQLPVEDHGVPYGTFPYPHGSGNVFRVPHAHVLPQNFWRNSHGLIHGAPPYETAIPLQLVKGNVPVDFVRGTINGSSCAVTALENLNTRVESSHRVIGHDCSNIPEYSHAEAVQLVPSRCVVENPVESIQLGVVSTEPASSDVPLTMANSSSLVDGVSVATQRYSESNKTYQINESSLSEATAEKSGQEETKDSGVCYTIDKNPGSSGVVATNTDESFGASRNLSENQLEFLPELIASVKEAALKSVKDIKAKAQEDIELSNAREDDSRVDARIQGLDGRDELETDSDNETVTPTMIELTKAEAEAIDRGLQTIKNEDLEEIRELGTGTYGSVYHGKWKGSDVAIKRIKSSCFAGKPSERERLFADFWKEALLLFSLHHPNVVSFYGVVRDGPDGSLATVTEFMVNGSLRQFLRKKDRTIDRRKRLLIAMDAAFGMEYLHGKNVVHFDLKCENLLVNIRDPHRPVCKIGDLGLSKVKQHTLVSGGVRGTLPWMAPELLSGKTNMVTEKIDVYSFGIVMWELLTGDEPYADMHCASIIGGIVNDTLRPEIPTWCDPEWKALMESCWSSDPSQRPSFSEISQTLRTMASAMNPK